MSLLTSPGTETNQDTRQSISLAAETNQGSDQTTSPKTGMNQDAGKSASLITESNQDSGTLILSTAGSYEGADQSTSLTTETNQDADPTLSAIGTHQDVGQSVSTTTETNRTFELILSTTEINRSTIEEDASAHEEGQPTENDPLLPPDPPAYHDIIPLFDDGSIVPPPPSSIFKSLFCCFFGAYYLYYASKIRSSRMILILLVACLSLPISALYMGFKYYFSCPVTPYIPLLLCVMGGVGLLLTILRIFTITSRSFRNLGVCEPPRIIAESSVICIACLMIVEMIQFYRILPVFDEPADSHYCPELLYEYVFYANYVVPAIGILALFLHIPTKRTNNLERILQEAAERDTLRQQQNVDDDVSEVYTAWVKPRRRRSRRNEENSDGNDSRSRNNEERVEICATSFRETTMGENAGDFQREKNIASGEARVRWMDEVAAVMNNTINNPCDEEGVPIGGEMCDERGAVGGEVVLTEYDIFGGVEGCWGHEVGAVGGDIEEGAVGGDTGENADYGGFETLLWDEREGLDTPPRNRSSTFTINRVEGNVTSNPSGYRRRDVENNGLRSQRLEEGSEYGARRKTRVTEEGGRRPKRKESDWDDANPLQTENAETEVRAFLSEGRVENEVLAIRWHEYGARPKIKAECVPKTEPRRSEMTEKAGVILRNKKDAEKDAFGNQENKGNEDGVRRKVKSCNTRSKMKDVERESHAERQRITKGTESDTEAKIKESSGDKIEKVAEESTLTQSEKSVDSSVTPKMVETTESTDSKKGIKRAEDDDIL